MKRTGWFACGVAVACLMAGSAAGAHHSPSLDDTEKQVTVQGTVLPECSEGSEAFNLFNHANFSQPASALFTSATARRSTAGVISGTATENRQIQFGMKLTF